MKVGERLLCSLLFVVLGAAVYYTESVRMLLSLFAAVAVHELCHVAAICLLRCRPTAISVEPGGFRIEYRGRDDSLAACVIALAGPLGGALLGAGTLILCRLSGSPVLLPFAELNLLLSAFNLMPILPLDGGRVLLALSSKMLGADHGTDFSFRVSHICTLMLLLLGGLCLYFGDGSAVLLAGIWLLCLQKGERPLAKGAEMG